MSSGVEALRLSKKGPRSSIYRNRSLTDSITSWHEFHDTYINPFTVRLYIGLVEYVKICLMSISLVPLRLTGIVLSVIFAWIFASIGMFGCTLQKLNEKPIRGWRKVIQMITVFFLRAMYAFSSFHWVTFVGKRATKKAAPILVVAPHSTFVDSIILAVLGPPVVVAKHETVRIPLLGKVICFLQPIFVEREDPNSRQTAVNEIASRSTNEKWPQVAIFPEGTCTNRKALIKFKAGAFYPGLPVQPVLLKYPNKYDTLTWSWEGPRALRIIWLTLSQLYTNCVIEFLPIYVPNEQEKTDPNLYAYNVREVMAEALNLPTSEYSFEDVIMMDRARNMNIPFSGDMTEIERLLFYMDFLDTESIPELMSKYDYVENRFEMDVFAFAGFLNVDVREPDLRALFHILDQHHMGYINIRHFLLCVIFCEYKGQDTMLILKAIKNLYVKEGDYLTFNDFKYIVKHAHELKSVNLNEMFKQIDINNKNKITFEEFEDYVQNRDEYKSLYDKHPHIRRHFKKDSKVKVTQLEH